MAGPDTESRIDLGSFARSVKRGGMGGLETIALILTLLWLGGSVVLFLISSRSDDGFDALRFVGTGLAIFMPVALIWIAAMTARSSRTMREECNRLHMAIDGMHQSYLSDHKTGPGGGSADVAQKLVEIAEAQKKTEIALATFLSVRNQPAPQAVTASAAALAATGEDQPSLALGTPTDQLSPPLPTEDFICALQFPENPEDKDGFRALRRALQDRTAAQLIQAAQDILTLLSQDGIYMDDLRPDRARPEIWRRFAQGERGRTVASLGGIRDRSSLALSSARMRSDTIFRDAAHHFLRKFDHTFSSFEKTATDADIVGLTETRTARAFMLLGRVTGTFD